MEYLLEVQWSDPLADSVARILFGRRAGLYAAEYAKALHGAVIGGAGAVEAIAREVCSPPSSGPAARTPTRLSRTSWR